MFKIPYFLEGIINIFKHVLTNEDPLEGIKAAENYRGKLKFNSELCIGCGICTRVCAGNAIKKKVKNNNEEQEITMIFDLASCTFCGLCKDFCPKKAIDLTNEIMMITNDKNNLIIEGKFIKKIPPKVQVKSKNVGDKN